MMRCHETLDRRALEMDRIIAERILTRPDLVDRVRKNLDRWESQHSRQLSCHAEWRAILDQPVSEIASFLKSDDQEACRLRQSSPFCGILTREERTRILLQQPDGTDRDARAT